MIATGLGAELIGLRVGYASISVTIGSNEDAIARIMTVSRHGVNHRLDNAVRDLISRIYRKELALDEINAELEKLVHETPKHPPWFVAVSVGIACAAFARLLGADWISFIPVFTGSAIGQYMRHHFLKNGVNSYVVAAAIAFIAAVATGLGAHAFNSSTINLAMVASTLLLVPGVPATNAQTDIMDGYPTLGSARAVSVMMIMLFITTGIWFAEALLGVLP